ncbi:MAG: dTDP-glucose 4,6-dehydratase [Deltaproteobacteria bacterium HGW-Deltaproteobacteria-6]|nr:MAG: dTDP-glucose 4,6-dehydratase [Deltaproteobacteria bacterium HGW-Deltaproteobacteria-6]PKN95964.1 MAG: dTDP-glucose 4,6-dehydratase [Chloroflexi bacterium HGW-Chloroflexi-5]
MSEKVMVIGSNSFSGASFVDYLLGEGIETIGISRSPEPHAVFLPYKKRDTSGFRFFELDLNRDLDRIMKIIDEQRPDYVVNFAAQSMVAESWRNPVHWFQTNVVATIQLHDELRKRDFLKKYVHVSTPEVYGSCEGLVRESTNYNPSTPYAVSRAAADMSLMSFQKAYGFPVAFTRAANVYGPGQQLYRIIPRTILFFLIGRKLQLHGGGHSIRSFIHFRDVADGTLRVARQASPGEIYHFSTARNLSIRNLVEMIAAQLGASFDENVEVVGERLGKDAAYTLDSTSAREKLQWQDKISLEQGIEETIAWVKDNLEEIKRQPFDYIHKP